MRLWVDTDIGDDPDDAVALAVAARHAAVELVGVSTVYGDVAARARDARDLLAALDVDVPVHAGPPPPDALAAVDALLAIGPLTNVAHLLAEAVPLPHQFVAMGGALGEVHHRGTVHRVEHNFGCDPTAARAVVAECEQLVLVPLDVTARCTMSDGDTDAVTAAVPALRAPAAAFRAATGARLCLHDPCALLVLVGDVAAEPRAVRLVVGTQGELVADDGARPTTVVVEVDPQAVIDRVRRVTEGTRTPGLRDHNPTL
jgi:inosine-uridine nucleoside N-ribohydrolase